MLLSLGNKTTLKFSRIVRAYYAVDHPNFSSLFISDLSCLGDKFKVFNFYVKNLSMNLTQGLLNGPFIRKDHNCEQIIDIYQKYGSYDVDIPMKNSRAARTEKRKFNQMSKVCSSSS